jgi:hypothetical protein
MGFFVNGMLGGYGTLMSQLYEDTADECISPDYPINTNLLRSRNLCIYNAALRIMTSIAPPLTAICTLPLVCPNS